MKYTVKQLAEKMGLSEHTLRYYTDIGLLPCERDRANHRIFNDESINWITGIKCLRSCGMSIESIKEYSTLCMQEPTKANLEARADIIKAQQKAAHERLKEAQETADYMDHKVAHYNAILAGRERDDTNPNLWTKLPNDNC